MSKKKNWKLRHGVRYLEITGSYDLKKINKGAWDSVAPLLEAEAGIKPKHGTMLRRGRYALDVLSAQGKLKGIIKEVKQQEKEKKGPDKIKQFYRSYRWRKVRMEVLIRDGRVCACCNAGPDSGRMMHVDHIKPLRLNWELRLVPDNLQVLCEVCNHGKGNWDETNWRMQK